MAAPDGTVDLRSDTVTRPSAAMRRAMAEAEVGDDQYGEDPTVNRLQERAAELLGMEAALLTPTGTMANQLALAVLGRRGTEVLCPARSHIRSFEAAAAAAMNGLQVHPLTDGEGRVDPAEIDAAVADSHHHLAPVSLCTIENTHMASGGRVVRPWPPSRRWPRRATGPGSRCTATAPGCGTRRWRSACRPPRW